VVHGGSGDFQVLRWIHPLVIDTFLLEGYVGHDVAKKTEEGKTGDEKVEGSGRGGKSLKDLCKRKLGIDVQTKGKLGHDSYEDAMATRELVLGWMSGIPDV
jgi:RNA exonuclease 1